MNSGEEKLWIAIPGCSFDPTDKTDAELENFTQDLFEITFLNIGNPQEEEDTSNFTIQIFKSWDEETDQPVELMVESNDFKLLGEQFALEGGVITDASLSVTGTILG